MIPILLHGGEDGTDFDGMFSGAHGWYSGTGWFWPVAMMLFWAAVIGLIIWVVIRVTKNNNPPAAAPPEALPAVETPRQILDRRLANGEIDAAQYEELRTRLDDPGSA